MKASNCTGWTDVDGTARECKRPDLRPGRQGGMAGKCTSCSMHQRLANRTRNGIAQAMNANAVPLHPRHVRQITQHVVTCANCGGHLFTGSTDELRATQDQTFTCAACSVAWRVNDRTLSEVAA